MRLIAQLARRSPPEAVREIWSSAGTASTQSTAPQSDFESSFAAFKEKVEAKIPDEDVDSYQNLAIAFSEMGMYRDALIYAANALGADPSGSRADALLQMILLPPLLLPGGLQALRERLRLRLLSH